MNQTSPETLAVLYVRLRVAGVGETPRSLDLTFYFWRSVQHARAPGLTNHMLTSPKQTAHSKMATEEGQI